MIAATIAVFELIVRVEACLNAAGNMRKLEKVNLCARLRAEKAGRYPIIIKSADRVAAGLQYQGVSSFSL